MAECFNQLHFINGNTVADRFHRLGSRYPQPGGTAADTHEAGVTAAETAVASIEAAKIASIEANAIINASIKAHHFF